MECVGRGDDAEHGDRRTVNLAAAAVSAAGSISHGLTTRTTRATFRLERALDNASTTDSSSSRCRQIANRMATPVLASSTQYFYRIFAVDANGNRSAASNTATATTLPRLADATGGAEQLDSQVSYQVERFRWPGQTIRERGGVLRGAQDRDGGVDACGHAGG